jgi:hypothetical protein
MSEKLDDLRAANGSGKEPKQKFQSVIPAITDIVFQVKCYCSTGVGPVWDFRGESSLQQQAVYGLLNRVWKYVRVLAEFWEA